MRIPAGAPLPLLTKIQQRIGILQRMEKPSLGSISVVTTVILTTLAVFAVTAYPKLNNQYYKDAQKIEEEMRRRFDVNILYGICPDLPEGQVRMSARRKFCKYLCSYEEWESCKPNRFAVLSKVVIACADKDGFVEHSTNRTWKCTPKAMDRAVSVLNRRVARNTPDQPAELIISRTPRSHEHVVANLVDHLPCGFDWISVRSIKGQLELGMKIVDRFKSDPCLEYLEFEQCDMHQDSLPALADALAVCREKNFSVAFYRCNDFTCETVLTFLFKWRLTNADFDGKTKEVRFRMKKAEWRKIARLYEFSASDNSHRFEHPSRRLCMALVIRWSDSAFVYICASVVAPCGEWSCSDIENPLTSQSTKLLRPERTPPYRLVDCLFQEEPSPLLPRKPCRPQQVVVSGSEKLHISKQSSIVPEPSAPVCPMRRPIHEKSGKRREIHNSRQLLPLRSVTLPLHRQADSRRPLKRLDPALPVAPYPKSRLAPKQHSLSQRELHHTPKPSYLSQNVKLPIVQHPAPKTCFRKQLPEQPDSSHFPQRVESGHAFASTALEPPTKKLAFEKQPPRKIRRGLKKSGRLPADDTPNTENTNLLKRKASDDVSVASTVEIDPEVKSARKKRRKKRRKSRHSGIGEAHNPQHSFTTTPFHPVPAHILNNTLPHYPQVRNDMHLHNFQYPNTYPAALFSHANLRPIRWGTLPILALFRPLLVPDVCM
ncbi:hypothetical protein QR680_000365 [Steinernema hermaphroditum]|uniref:Uncharacterized protein n=1 Tax=Steinernema hermaphroditum TaxID=289476 RepID=A0AA39GVW2_9BILA|nr:hypothetical protein QR680_000365 [Steinernema hermaphroditum]